MKTITMTIAALTLVATSVLAQSEPMDTDANGTFSLEELMAAYPELSQDTFEAMDTNADGAVDAGELIVAQEGGLVKAAE